MQNIPTSKCSNKHSTPLRNALISTLLCSFIFSCSPKPTAENEPFGDEQNNTVIGQNNEMAFTPQDKIVFIGDSITHGGSYHKNIALFHATRFPKHILTYKNAGISGDTAAGTLRRFETDIASFNADVATIMLGMNDVGRYLYEKSPSNKAQETKKASEQARIQKKYISEISNLASKLQANGTRIIYIKPSIFDQTAELPMAKMTGINDALLRMGDALVDISAEYPGEVVDFQSPMLEVNKVLQAQDPAASIVGKDRVHPGPLGHFVMSYSFLRQQITDPYINKIVFDVEQKISGLYKCDAQGVPVIKPDFVSFSCTSESLPFVLDNNQMAALEWVPFQQDLNQQFLKQGRRLLLC
jgi:lysophospholipase L1-like esterase